MITLLIAGSSLSASSLRSALLMEKKAISEPDIMAEQHTMSIPAKDAMPTFSVGVLMKLPGNTDKQLRGTCTDPLGSKVCGFGE